MSRWFRPWHPASASFSLFHSAHRPVPLSACLPINPSASVDQTTGVEHGPQSDAVDSDAMQPHPLLGLVSASLVLLLLIIGDGLGDGAGAVHACCVALSCLLACLLLSRMTPHSSCASFCPLVAWTKIRSCFPFLCGSITLPTHNLLHHFSYPLSLAKLGRVMVRVLQSLVLLPIRTSPVGLVTRWPFASKPCHGPSSISDTFHHGCPPACESASRLSRSWGPSASVHWPLPDHLRSP